MTIAADPTLFAAGPPPEKASDSVNLSFSMVNIPLAVYSGVDGGIKVTRQTFTHDGHPVGMRRYDKITECDIGPDEVIVKRAAASDGTLVELTDDEISQAVGNLSGSEVEAFIPLSYIGSLYQVDSIHHLRVKKIDAGKRKLDNVPAVKAFALFRRAMDNMGVAALFRVALRGAPRWACLTPDGHMLMLRYAEEVRQEAPAPEVEASFEFSDKELEMATMLINSIGIGTPVPADESSAKVQAYVDAKAAGTVAVADAPESQAAAGADDLVALMQASIDAAKPKPTKAPAKRTAKRAATAA